MPNENTSLLQKIKKNRFTQIKGRVKQVIGTVIHVILPDAKLGDLCYLHSIDYQFTLYAEVVGFNEECAILTPIGEIKGISTTTIVENTGQTYSVPIGAELQGRILDGMGYPLDKNTKGPLNINSYIPAYRSAPHPLTRNIIDKPLALGIKAIDGLLTCGEGQRIGIFAAAGGGKSTTLSMIIKSSEADINVVALVGERGREVREFIELQLTEEGIKNTIIVVATSDRPAMEQVKAAYTATTIAEYYREQGLKVLMIMDSVTRFARAQRAVGLASGEPPTRRGFPPSVFAQLPALLERTGQSHKGSITAIYTVLVEGNDMTEPVADETRSLLDGHIILSRELAEEGHYPAIDVLASTSRVMSNIISSKHAELAKTIKKLMASYKSIELLVKVGEYKQGSDQLSDMALKKHDIINKLLQQRTDESVSFQDTISFMETICSSQS